MNVPLKKRHKYGRINGSASTIHNQSAKGVHSNGSNDEGSELESSMTDATSVSRPATLRHPLNQFGKRSHQYMSLGDRARPSVEFDSDESTGDSLSESVLMTSSASNHDSSEKNVDESNSSSESDSSGSSNANQMGEQLTVALLTEHNAKYQPMSSRERIRFWNIADELSEIEDDFNDSKYFSKPTRSERLQKRMYKKPTPAATTTTKKSKKYDSPKTDEMESNSPNKSKEKVTPNKTKRSPKSVKSTKSAKSVKTPKSLKSTKSVKTTKSVKKKQTPAKSPTKVAKQPEPSTPATNPSTPLVSRRSIVEHRPVDVQSPSAIRYRISYGKESSPSHGGCVNCVHPDPAATTIERPALATNQVGTGNQEEFYKYLGIDTNPSQEKPASETSPTDATLYNRRSLRVFIQQRQYEFSKSAEKAKQSTSPDQRLNSSKMSGDQSTEKKRENGKIIPRLVESPPNSTISSHIKQRRSYEPSTSTNQATEANTRQNADVSSRLKTPNETTKIVRRRLLPGPTMITQILKRYKQCLKQDYLSRRQAGRNNAARKRKLERANADIAKAVQVNGEEQTNGATASNYTEDLKNAFSPTSITHSNASTDSAIVMHPKANEKPVVTVSSVGSLQWQQEQANHVNKAQFRNPLSAKKGAVLAVLTHSSSPSDDDVVVVVQESQISYWYSTSKVLSMFGIPRAWHCIGEIPRINIDQEVNTLYQHRLIDIGDSFPVYLEMRAAEASTDEFRQCFLTFVYLNVYFVKKDDEGHPQIVMERVHLDTLKGLADSIYYTTLSHSPSVLMTWTEHNINNQTRCCIIKYTLKTPSLDGIAEIFDYSFLQHDINTLYALNEHHVVGCGDRTITMWDHRNGNLLIDVEIDLPTIGRNIGCYTVGVDVPEYMLLAQLVSAEGVEGCDNQLKVMAVQTVDPYNWRTLHTHNIPNSYGRIQSIFNVDDMLTITFSSGSIIFLNVLMPHKIYSRNVTWPNDPAKIGAQANGVSSLKRKDSQLNQLFAQSNGQIVEFTNDVVATKAIWEYFVEKE